jgi:hypothetical protein
VSIFLSPVLLNAPANPAERPCQTAIDIIYFRECEEIGVSLCPDRSRPPRLAPASFSCAIAASCVRFTQTVISWRDLGNIIIAKNATSRSIVINRRQ